MTRISAKAVPKSRPVVVFVDDDRNVLSGLRRMLHRRQTDWEMHFVADAESLFALFEQNPASVLVTDVRMSDMDGIELLKTVGERWPQTSRYVLSGCSDAEVSLRSVGIAHQFLAKPTDGPTLIAAIDHALALQYGAGGLAVARAVAKLSAIPALPSTYGELTAYLRKGWLDSKSIEAIVHRDPGITARLLQIANSSFYGAAKPITSVHSAVQLLGVETIQSLVLTYGLIDKMVHTIIGGLPIAQCVVSRMLATSRLARQIALDLQREELDQECAATAGLLADVGLLFLIENFASDVEKTGSPIAMSRTELRKLESATLGVPHALVAAYILGTWGLPISLTDPVADQSERAIGDLSTTGQIVALSSRLIEGENIKAASLDWPLENWVKIAANLRSIDTAA